VYLCDNEQIQECSNKVHEIKNALYNKEEAEVEEYFAGALDR
jgi:hypothetical protein